MKSLAGRRTGHVTEWRSRALCVAATAILAIALIGSIVPVAAATVTPTVSATMHADGTVALSWQFPPNAQRTQYLIDRWDVTTGTRAGWGYLYSSPTTTGAVIEGLLPGRTYSFTVTELMGTSQGNAVTTGTVHRPTPGCPASYCVAVDTSVTLGPAAHVAQGLLSSVSATTPSPLISGLAPTSWRIQPFDRTRYAAARTAGGAITMVLSDGWMSGSNYDNGRPIHNPWDDWQAYASWVSSTVAWHKANNMAPDYWDIQNEPDASQWYGTATPPTRSLVLQQFRVAYGAIKAADPTAKIIGPSLGNAEIDAPSQLLDFRSFLTDAAVNGLRYDALAWHENGTGPVGTFEGSARVIGEHVGWIRQELTQYPSLGSPALFVNEYGPPFAQNDPASEVAYLSMLERLGVAAAVHSCFPMTVAGSTVDTCSDPRGVLDGLLTPDGQPTSAWWVHHDYAAMTGTRVFADGNAPNLHAFATQSANGEIDVLIGNDDSCSSAVTDQCPVAAPVGRSIPATLAVVTPGGFGSYAVTATVSPYQSGPASQPGPAALPAPVYANGVLSVSLPALGPGEAFHVRLVPQVGIGTSYVRLAPALTIVRNASAPGGIVTTLS